MKKIGLTGSIGMGKSTVANMFICHGIPVFDSDASVHKLYQDKDIIEKIAYYFPQSYDVGNKSIDRIKLSSIIFGDLADTENNKYILESIIHPAVKQEQQKFIMRSRNYNKKMIVFDIPLLYETQAENNMDYVIVTTAPYFIQKQRVLSRHGMTEDKFHKILDSQMPDKEKVRRADFIIRTAENKAIIHRKLKNIIKIISTN